MNSIFKTLSLAPRGIKNKLTIAFVVMSVIPILACGYVISYYILPTISTVWEIYLIGAISLFLMLMGFYLAKMIIYPIAEIAAHAKGVAKGKVGQVLDIRREDEIGELTGSLNTLSTKLKENMSALHSYGEKIKQINMEINKKMFALSGLLQIGNMITSSAPLDDVFNLIAEKLSQLQQGGPALVMLVDQKTGELNMRAQTNINVETREIETLDVKIGKGAIGRVFESAQPLIADRKRRLKACDQTLASILPTKNLALVPISSRGAVVGILGVGNSQDKFVFSEDELELLGVFAKQVAVAVENDLLLRKTEELTIRDELTGVYNEKYIRNRLSEEIKRAVSYQRPCSFAIFELDNFKAYRDLVGEIPTERILKKIAQVLKDSSSEIDKAARFSDNQFALVLPEKNKQQSLQLAQNIKKAVERFTAEEVNKQRKISLSFMGGISAAPVDGTTALDLINTSLAFVEKAKAKAKGIVAA